MAVTTLTVSDFARVGEFWTQFKGERIDHITITLENGEQIKTRGLLHISNRWYINGPVRDSYIISTLCGGPVQVTSKATIQFQKPPGAKAFRKPVSPYRQIW